MNVVGQEIIGCFNDTSHYVVFSSSFFGRCLNQNDKFVAHINLWPVFGNDPLAQNLSQCSLDENVKSI